jgi:hypothetical protein
VAPRVLGRLPADLSYEPIAESVARSVCGLVHHDGVE